PNPRRRRVPRSRAVPRGPPRGDEEEGHGRARGLRRHDQALLRGADQVMSGPSGARGDTPEALAARNSEARDARKAVSGRSGARGDTPEALAARNSEARDARKKVSAIGSIAATTAVAGVLIASPAEARRDRTIAGDVIKAARFLQTARLDDARALLADLQ